MLIVRKESTDRKSYQVEKLIGGGRIGTLEI